MKKILYLLYFLLSIFMFHMNIGMNSISFIMSFGFTIVLYSAFSNVSIKELYRNKDNYLKSKYFLFTSLLFFILFIFMSLLFYFFFNYINKEHFIVAMVMNLLFVFSLIIFKLIKEYLEELKYKKIERFVNYYFYFSTFILEVISIILFRLVFKINSYINTLVLYGIPIFNVVLIFLFLTFFVLKRNMKGKKEKIKLRNIITSLIRKENDTIYNIIKAGYIYSSIIILYFILINRYNYDGKVVINYLTSLYFYGLIFIYYFYLLIKKIFGNKYNVLDQKIKEKDKNIDGYFHSLINVISKYSMGMVILLMVISGPITNVLYKGEYNFIFDLAIFLFFYILYDVVMKINILCNERRFKLVLLLGFFVGIIFEVPLIDSFYRMGYTLSFGGISSIVLGYIISIILGFIFIYKKLKINFLNNFTNILNIIYQNIILCVILVLFTFILDVKSNNIWYSIINIIVYSGITIFYYFTIKIIKK